MADYAHRYTFSSWVIAYSDAH